MTKLPVSLASVFAATALTFGAGVAQASTCAPKGADPVDAVREMYAEAVAGDRAKTLAAFDHEGFLFDGGVRYTPAALVDIILKGEAAGTKPQWNIEGAESHTTCHLAWATWTNKGSFTTKAGTEPMTWLESAVFVWRDEAWKIRFFHSTTVAPAS